MGCLEPVICAVLYDVVRCSLLVVQLGQLGQLGQLEQENVEHVQEETNV